MQEQQGLHELQAWLLSACTAQACLVVKKPLCHSCSDSNCRQAAQASTCMPAQHPSTQVPTPAW